MQAPGFSGDIASPAHGLVFRFCSEEKGVAVPVVHAKKRTRSSIRVRWIAAIIFLIAIVPTVLFGLRTYGSFLLLRSAYAVGAPMTSSIRPWMTLKYVAAAYRAPESALATRLELTPGTDPNTSLKTLADQAGVTPSAYVQRVQQAVADLVPEVRSNRDNGSSSWLRTIGDQALTALLVYGYPALGLILLLGAIGLPLPDGVATIVAGSLASQGRIDWLPAAVIVVAASVVGDAVGYGLGRLLSQELLDRHGRWFGYTSARYARAQSLFDRWGLIAVFVTRTFMSYLSSIASLLAGISRYRLSKFLAMTFFGRLVWTAGYLGLGYGIGSDWEAAAGFLTNLSALLLLSVLLFGSSVVASGRSINSS
jgi:membrane protein DedA with SNARE-associated domain